MLNIRGRLARANGIVETRRPPSTRRESPTEGATFLPSDRRQAEPRGPMNAGTRFLVRQNAGSKAPIAPLKTRLAGLPAVESRMGAGADRRAPPRFPSPLIKPDVPISGIRLSDWLHRRLTNGRYPSDPGAARRPTRRRSASWKTDGCLARTPCAAVSGSAVHVPRHVRRPPGKLSTCSRRPKYAFQPLRLLIQLVAHPVPWSYIPRLQDVCHFRFDPLHALL